MTQGLYDLLGIARDANSGDIKRAFKHAALRHHPDKGGDTESFQKVQQALETLTDDNKRASYDRSLVRNRATDGLSTFFHDVYMLNVYILVSNLTFRSSQNRSC